MIKPEDIPQFTGDLDALQRHITGLRRDADGIRQAGGAAHTQFQAMSAFYKAPEAEDLFASTMPVRDKADAFAEKVETVAGALEEYAQTVGPIAEKLKHLKAKAGTFIAGLDTDGGAFGTDWTKDQDKVDQHEALWNELAVARAAFYAAEITASNKITALVAGGTKYMADTGGTMFVPRGVTTYGFTADALKNADELPWGTPAERSHHAWDLGYHGKQLLWDGLVMDGIVGSLKGAAALAGLRGPGEARAAWNGLTRTLVGTSVYATEMGGGRPGGSFWNTDFVQGSKPYAKGFAKGLVAWDQWRTNPGRAAGTTIFNFGTLGAGPVKLATAGRAGAMAKAANAAAKAGEGMDPIVAAATTARTLPRVADIAAGVRAGGRGVLDGPYRLVDEGGHGRVRAAAVPDTAMRYTDSRGKTIYLTDQGTIVDEHNRVLGDLKKEGQGEREPSAAQRAAATAAGETPSHRKPVPVGALTQGGEGKLVGRGGENSGSGSRDAAGPAWPPSENHGASSPETSAHASGGGSGTSGPDGGTGDGDTPHLVRQDDNFAAEHNRKGQRKSHLSSDGDLVPANPDGNATVVDHIVGRDPAKSDSPYTSLSREGADAKAFGAGRIRVDLARLERDIADGKVTGVEVLSPERVQAELQRSADDIAGRPVDISLPPGATRADIPEIARSLGLSKGKTKRIMQRMIDMMNTKRDEEWLIKGVVPHRYITGPFGD
ncbi:hypothetical protein [Streptomyces alboflavus]|uniref:hypothetical protein n=1 Tax=Streptomyces alboflavus TaxID=67267 RepID=UPI0006906CE8|nr:hypothetical protein [Streptomyces alboflavus]